VCAQWQDEIGGPHDEPTEVTEQPGKVSNFL